MKHLDLLRSIVSMMESSTAAAAMFSHFANRKRNRKAETVRRLMQVCGVGTKRSAIIAVLRQLETLGLGRVIVGRHKHESRFEWGEV